MRAALVIDQTGQPLDVISWQRAVCAVVKGTARVLETDPSILIRSIREVYEMPLVLMIPKHIKRGKQKVTFRRWSVFWRDGFRCQYCDMKPLAEEINKLTYDHAIPKSLGGKTTWENVVTACEECNSRKANRTPAEAGMHLRRAPAKPKWVPPITVKLEGTSVPKIWLQYWNTALEK